MLLPMAENTTWAPKIEKRAHPFGEKGVRSSLEEVAKKASEGANSFRVQKWVGDVLDAARSQGSKVDSAIGRARALLKAAQQKLWKPDPVGTEWIAGAHLLACKVDDPDGPCLKAGDCDDLAVLLGAACTNAGIPTLIVGHGYDAEKNISHVLCAVHANGRWWYADPSTDFPLGQHVKFTRERILAIPSGKVVCDAANCLVGGKRAIDPDVVEPAGGGMFVGVNGLPDNMPTASSVRWLGSHVGDAVDTTAQSTGKAGGAALCVPGGPVASLVCGKIGSDIANAIVATFRSGGLPQEAKDKLYLPVSLLWAELSKATSVGSLRAIALSAEKYNAFLGGLAGTQIGFISFGDLMDAGDVSSFADWGAQLQVIKAQALAKASQVKTGSSSSGGGGAVVVGGAALLALLFFL